VRFYKTLIILSMAALHRAAIAQSPSSITVRVDNDAFDFWMAPWNRPDDEYSSGVHITYDGGDAPWWARHFMGGAQCTIRSTSCRANRFAIGQDMYTPARSAENPVAAQGSRRNAGWLYLSQGARSLREDRLDELTITLGVTGPPSLGEFMQKVAHSVAPSFNRPADWSDQIAFEPGAIIRYEERWRVPVSDGAIGIDLIPRWAANVGNVSTSAEAGFQARVGWHLPHPWLPTSETLSLAFTAGASGRAIARDLFLDGNTFRSGHNVGHETFVRSGELGVQLRVWRFSLAYRAVSDSRSYANAPAWHPWASMVGGVTFER
jgi:lipid A 3-O-deacylase